MNPALHIRLLGLFELNWGAAALLAPASPKTRSLLGFLILRHDRPQSRLALAGSLWPERSDAAARRALSQALWQIRCALGGAAGRLAADREAVTFNLYAGDWLDVMEFSNRVDKYTSRQGRVALSTCPLSTCLLELSRAVELYRGDLLQDVYDDWALVERERLREMYLGALEHLITLHKQAGQYEQALACAQRLAAADPLRESAHRELIRLYHLLGRSRAAVEQFTLLRGLLADELDAAPDSATVALYREISSALDAGREPARAAAPPVLGDLAHLPFVGRASQRAALLDALHAAAHGNGGLVLIEGDAGVGKTRLALQIVADAQWRGFQVGTSKADPLVAPSPYQSLCGALSPLLTPLRVAQLAERVEPARLGAIAPLLPSLAEHLPNLPTLPALELAEEQQRLGEGLAHCVAGLASIAPLLLVLDDLHWADESTLAALPALVSRAPEHRLLIIIACRTAEARERASVQEALEALDRALPVLRLRLAPLERAEALDLVRRALGTGQADAQATLLAGQLQDEAQGNALFLLEILKSLVEQGLLAPSPGGWRFPSTEIQLAAPASVQHLIAERWARLPPALQSALELVAVLGAEADYAVLARAQDASSAELTDHLEQLCWRGFLAQTASGYCFEHDLIQETVYQAIEAERRRMLHRRAAQSIEATRCERVEALAFHFDRGGVPDKALMYSQQAGDRARSLRDYGAALAHYRRAVELVGDEPASRWEALSRQERALDILARRQEQAETLDEMLRLADALADPLRRARTRHLQGWQQVLAGEPSRALALLDGATALAREAGDLDLLAHCLISTAYAWWRMSEADRCRAAAEQAISLFRQANNRAGENRALNILGNLDLLTGHYARSLGSFKGCERVSQEMDDHYAVACALGNIGIVYSLLGCYEQSQKMLEETWQTMTRVGDRNWQGIIYYWRGTNQRRLGELAQAQQTAREALGVCRQVGNNDFEQGALELLGLIALDQQDPKQAVLYLQQAVEIAHANQQPSSEAISLAHLAWACLRAEHREEALRLAEQAVAVLERLGQISQAENVYFEHYQVVAAIQGGAAARPSLERAFQILQAAAAEIDDPDLRRAFLENVPEHRAIEAAHHLGRLPTALVRQTVRLPALAVPLGRPLRDDELAEVTWTLAAPEDDDAADAIARRRGRLLRLLREAAAQAAAPTVEALAAALGVAGRTVKRDLAALRAEGHHVSTRRQR